MNYFEYLFGVNKPEKVAEDVNLSLHDKRYHRNGIGEHTHCKYRVLAESRSEPISNRLHYDMISPQTDFVGAKTYLAEKHNIECYHTHSGAELIENFMFHRANAKVYDTCGTPVSNETYEENVRKFYAVVKDIDDRLGDIPFEGLMFLPFQIRGTIGASSLDLRIGTTHESFISIGDLRNARPPKTVYQHDDERLPYDIIRHEIGHNLATDEVYRAWCAFADSKGNKYNDFISKSVSEYATTVYDEAIAETFSKVTSPDYDGSLSQELERIVAIMLGYDEGPLKMTTDENPKRKRRAEDVNPIYFSSFDFVDMDGDGIQWYDRSKGDYVTFKSYVDKLKFGLKCYKIPEQVVKALASLKERKWSAGDIQKIAMEYYSLGESCEEILKSFASKTEENK